MSEDVVERITVGELDRVFYAHADHHRVADKGLRRYQPFGFDFDSTALMLDEPADHWEEQVRLLHLENRDRAIARLKEQYGVLHHDQIVQNLRDLGPKAFSLIAYHNRFYHEAREAFVIGSYYPALVATCALGERILNHLILDLREDFKSSPHYRRVYRKESFDDWAFATGVLSDWNVLVEGVAEDLLELSKLRHRSIHFNPETYRVLREDALAALKLIGDIVSKQFGFFGRQPWFIEGTAGAQFIKKSYEAHPFVRKYLVPQSGFVGVLYGMERRADGHWQHLDLVDYGDGEMVDDEFAKAFGERDPEQVVTRAMIQAQRAEEGSDA
ncbi:hypothetical protein [Rhizobium leguminosarum]|uniref:hypothetical protein n=1 Tax=Rhizobium leguminosarum TaxID=384 RepID=UPI001AEA77D0|nr:hypothetical protein [Rhizobium leguminosarum]MBP2443782.1 hypothetical protein [Rhizobium leguminosarum]